jgi:hypothetical protein
MFAASAFLAEHSTLFTWAIWPWRTPRNAAFISSASFLSWRVARRTNRKAIYLPIRIASP